MVGYVMQICVKDGNLPGRAKDGICGRVVRELTCRAGGDTYVRQQIYRVGRYLHMPASGRI